MEVKRYYYLRSRSSSILEEVVSLARLALNKIQKPQSGRKSLLSKGQVEAALDIKDGKHATIKRDLKVLS